MGRGFGFTPHMGARQTQFFIPSVAVVHCSARGGQAFIWAGHKVGMQIINRASLLVGQQLLVGRFVLLTSCENVAPALQLHSLAPMQQHRFL